MTEVQQPAAPVAPVKPAVPQKLTAEEENERYTFIGKCVDSNTNFPGGSRWGVPGGVTLQDLCNSTPTTLRDIGKRINKELTSHDPEFDGTEPLKIAGIPAEKWANFIRLTIRKKMYNTLVAEKRAEVKKLKATIEMAKTPDELRREAEAQLAVLRGELGSEAE